MASTRSSRYDCRRIRSTQITSVRQEPEPDVEASLLVVVTVYEVS
jgi:hypothetical protein